ncbi:hypothetical protein ABZ553_03085 [Streptomyces sparsogenes]|uniref:hypothetical protein n=1 Tax=Streptomyces sparsogenes TaxID=67365 RepID=UPI0033E5D644
MDAELLVLRHENAVLRRQLAGPVRYEWADRLWFVALSSLAPWQHWAHVLLRGSDIHRSTRLLRWAFPVDGEAVGVAWCGVVLVEQSAE